MATSKWGHESVISTPVILPASEQRKIIEARTQGQNEQLARYNAHKLFAAHSKPHPYQTVIPSRLPSDWMEDAECIGANPDDFFPDQGVVPKKAKELCGKCSVRISCLEYALEVNEPLGIWGGHGIKERRRMRTAWMRQKDKKSRQRLA